MRGSGWVIIGRGFSREYWRRRDGRRRLSPRWHLAGVGGRCRFDPCPPGHGPGSRRGRLRFALPEWRPGGIARPGRAVRSGNRPSQAWPERRLSAGFCLALTSAIWRPRARFTGSSCSTRARASRLAVPPSPGCSRWSGSRTASEPARSRRCQAMNPFTRWASVDFGSSFSASSASGRAMRCGPR